MNENKNNISVNSFELQNLKGQSGRAEMNGEKQNLSKFQWY